MRRAAVAFVTSILLCASARAQGILLDGGSLARFDRPASIAFPNGADEWEAFLSLDGGRYYAIRITPHLDAGVRSFVWRVPNVASRDARILIRVGDEHRERVIELPSSFTIVPDPLCIGPELGTSVAAGAEAARPGDPLVSEWAAGDRRGANVEAHRRDGESVAASRRLEDDEQCIAVPPAIAMRSEKPQVCERIACTCIFRRIDRAISRDLLQQTGRLNI